MQTLKSWFILVLAFYGSIRIIKEANDLIKNTTTDHLAFKELQPELNPVLNKLMTATNTAYDFQKILRDPCSVTTHEQGYFTSELLLDIAPIPVSEMAFVSKSWHTFLQDCRTTPSSNKSPDSPECRPKGPSLAFLTKRDKLRKKWEKDHPSNANEDIFMSGVACATGYGLCRQVFFPREHAEEHIENAPNPHFLRNGRRN